MNWFGVSKFDPRVVDIYSRHYSAKKRNKTRQDWLKAGITEGCESMTLLTVDGSALFVWTKPKFRRDDQKGVNCAVFRNEGEILSSDLIREAEQLAWARWPNERLFTFVDGSAVKGDGACFKHAGWKKLNQRSKAGLIILEKLPEVA